ncbi:FHA domain-containing protein [Humisphaera borealis]|uniref:FHA domain-containing protein n=1 Tax=Humisphaera borealis TaxID=2807512 RepID=A0A7M2WYD2_9BACT|nr:FHA domain-containing protein [Humisphaera borealis]QOV90517.1 FHA domain-containing protein [Humisphaera borealis]
MAYVVVSFKDKEVGRWPLGKALSIGRAGECDIIVRDILLSRRHCQFEPSGAGWVAVDLGSKNGTRRGRQRINRHGLADGDVLTMGKTTVRFVIGRLPTEYKPPAKRPTDPFEALSGTVSDFDPVAAEAFCRENGLPKPQPIPREPAAYAKDDLYGLLNEIASSSWDSIYAQASQPKRPIPRNGTRVSSTARAGVDLQEPGVAVAPRKRSRLAFSEELQVKDARTSRPIRPASPLDLSTLSRAGGTLTSRSAASKNAARRSQVALTFGVIARPFVALHRWIAPAGRIRMF